MTLQQISEQVWWLGSAVSSVVVDNGAGGALLIDTGLDSAQARKLLRGLGELGLTPAAILNSHSHADHFGGNAFILKEFPDIPVYAPPLEAAIIQYPVLEPLYLYGAMPPKALQNKFLMAPASPAQVVPEGQHVLGGAEVELVCVPGHAAEMYAVHVGEVLYAADALFGEEALSKHPLTFCVDSAAQKASALKLAQLGGVSVALVGHGGPCRDLPALAQANAKAYGRTTRLVHEALRGGPASVDGVLRHVADALSLHMAEMGPLLLNRTVISAHLKELLSEGEVTAKVDQNHLLFELC